MYEDLDCFEKALSHFGTRVDMICAMEMGGKIDAETAYQNIKMELKELRLSLIHISEPTRPY